MTISTAHRAAKALDRQPPRVCLHSLVLLSAALPALIGGCAPGDEAGSPSETASVEGRVVPGWPALAPGVTTGETSGVGVDSHGHVFVFHRGQGDSILRLEPETGRVVSSFGEGLFENAHGLAIGPSDEVWVTDTKRHQVLRFSHDGDLQASFGERGVPGDDLEHFDQPTDVAIAQDGSFYVSDGYGNNRVVQYSAEGEVVRTWGEQGAAPGQFDLPHGISLDPNGRVYVADRSNQRVQVFEGDGTFVAAWDEGTFGVGSRAWGLEYAQGRLYVIDGGNMNPLTEDYAKLSVVDDAGRLLDQWSGYGEGPGQLSWGHDVAVGADGAVYTAEVRNANRAQKFAPAMSARPQ